MGGDAIELTSRGGEVMRLQAPDALATLVGRLDDARLLHNVQVLRHGLARDWQTAAQLRDGLRSTVAETCDETEPRAVAQGGEDPRGRGQVARGRAPGWTADSQDACMVERMRSKRNRMVAYEGLRGGGGKYSGRVSGR
jgi:hypothetical protein